MLPLKIPVHSENTGHIQGIAIDADRKYVYCSFTTELAKFDTAGNLVGSVKGLVGHLGCIAYNYDDGKVYGSLEYKHDAIGSGILKSTGSGAVFEEGFYIAVFDAEKIDRIGMDAEKDGVMTAVYMDEVTRDYKAEGHRLGCSGIDGTTFAPPPGEPDEKKMLCVAYGVYGDNDRSDNDYQVILAFDTSDFLSYARPLCQTDMHRLGPKPAHKYFVYTGNTNYGVQNLEYDPYTNRTFMAVYRGKKPQFPNYTTFAIDMSVPAEKKRLSNGVEGELLTLSNDGEYDEKSGVRGWYFNVGSTGIASLGDGFYYFSHNREDYQNRKFFSDIRLYGWDGKSPFSIIEE